MSPAEYRVLANQTAVTEHFQDWAEFNCHDVMVWKVDVATTGVRAWARCQKYECRDAGCTVSWLLYVQEVEGHGFESSVQERGFCASGVDGHPSCNRSTL